MIKKILSVVLMSAIVVSIFAFSSSAAAVEEPTYSWDEYTPHDYIDTSFMRFDDSFHLFNNQSETEKRNLTIRVGSFIYFLFGTKTGYVADPADQDYNNRFVSSSYFISHIYNTHVANLTSSDYWDSVLLLCYEYPYWTSAMIDVLNDNLSLENGRIYLGSESQDYLLSFLNYYCSSSYLDTNNWDTDYLYLTFDSSKCLSLSGSQYNIIFTRSYKYYNDFWYGRDEPVSTFEIMSNYTFEFFSDRWDRIAIPVIANGLYSSSWKSWNYNDCPLNLTLSFLYTDLVDFDSFSRYFSLSESTKFVAGQMSPAMSFVSNFFINMPTALYCVIWFMVACSLLLAFLAVIRV